MSEIRPRTCLRNQLRGPANPANHHRDGCEALSVFSLEALLTTVRRWGCEALSNLWSHADGENIQIQTYRNNERETSERATVMTQAKTHTHTYHISKSTGLRKRLRPKHKLDQQTQDKQYQNKLEQDARQKATEKWKPHQ